MAVMFIKATEGLAIPVAVPKSQVATLSPIVISIRTLNRRMGVPDTCGMFQTFYLYRHRHRRLNWSGDKVRCQNAIELVIRLPHSISDNVIIICPKDVLGRLY